MIGKCMMCTQHLYNQLLHKETSDQQKVQTDIQYSLWLKVTERNHSSRKRSFRALNAVRCS